MVSSAQVFELAAPVVATYPNSAFDRRGEMQDWLSTINNGSITGAILWTLAALIGLALLLAAVRFFRGSRQGTYVAGGRNRRPRLAVIDATPVDTQRRLVLIRRDHVEHLVLIGGQSDLVIERGIPVAPPQTHMAAPAQPVAQPQTRRVVDEQPRERDEPRTVATASETEMPSGQQYARAGAAGLAAAGAVSAAGVASATHHQGPHNNQPADAEEMNPRQVYEEQAALLREREAVQDHQASEPDTSTEVMPVREPEPEVSLDQFQVSAEPQPDARIETVEAREPQIDLPEPQQEHATAFRSEPYFTIPASEPEQSPAPLVDDPQPASQDDVTFEETEFGSTSVDEIATPAPDYAHTESETLSEQSRGETEPGARTTDPEEDDPDLTLEREMSRLLDDLGEDRGRNS